MQCKYVRESPCLCFTFHPRASSIFYLTNKSGRLRVVEENLYTGLVMNQLAVPFRQQNLNVDNYGLNYSEEGKLIVLTLFNHILVYSCSEKSLVVVGEAVYNKTPCFIEETSVSKGILFFTATDHHALFALSLTEAVRLKSINQFVKFKLPPDVMPFTIALAPNRLVALCSDSNLRVWDTTTTNPLKGAELSGIGKPTCATFSKDSQYLLIGTSTGVVQVWDGQSLGVRNTIVLNKALCKERIQSLAWFHYSGEAQSRRFLMLTRDGNVKLFSFYFQRAKEGKEKWMGRANQLSLLYINKCQIKEHFTIRSHSFANFAFFHPGVLLYMVDYYPRLYYPVISPQLASSFEALTPHPTSKEIAFQGNFFFLDGLHIKRLGSEIENKIALGSVLEYDGLKVLRMDYRPKFANPSELPLRIEKGSPSEELRYKFMLTYYLGNMVRSMVLSNIRLLGGSDNIQKFKEYSGHCLLFLGPPCNVDPLILILQEDRQTVTVLAEQAVADPSYYNEEERPHLRKEGQIYSRQLKIKVQKIFQTPFRNNYVVLYLSDNLVRFSNNIQIQSQLIDYDAYTALGLRLDYNDIVIDIVWTSRGELGCVVCLERVVFINDDLKIVRSVPIEGYAIQGQFVGYTLVLTTKVDVQYVDITGKPLQLYCIENYQSRYLILGILADRIMGLEKFEGNLTCKVRYFNLMQPLLSGYISYYGFLGAPANGQAMKQIVEGMAPYHGVSEQFLSLLNRSGWAPLSRYFIESQIKFYSRGIRAMTMNAEARMERFIDKQIWLQHSNKILDWLLYYQDMKDSSDNYEVEKSKEYLGKLANLLGPATLKCVQQVLEQELALAQTRLTLSPNFGQQAMFQVFYEYSEKEKVFVKMEWLPFKANDDRQWIGLNASYLESKIGRNDNEDIDINAVQEEKEENEIARGNQPEKDQSQQEETEFSNLMVYYRFDDGKGEYVDDLSNYNNEGYLTSTEPDPWILLDSDPMECQDKWGKKCIAQYSVSVPVRRQKKLGGKKFRNFSVQLWFRSVTPSCQLFSIGDSFSFGLQNNSFQCQHKQSVIKMGSGSEQTGYTPGVWAQITLTYLKKTKEVTFYLNSFPIHTSTAELRLTKDSLEVGSKDLQGQITEFRLWRKALTHEYVREYLRSPLEIVAEKRSRLRAKIGGRAKKKKQAEEGGFEMGAFDM